MAETNATKAPESPTVREQLETLSHEALVEECLILADHFLEYRDIALNLMSLSRESVALNDEAKRIIGSLMKQRDEARAEYDKLYAEWKVKNEACNTAYAVEIPLLTAQRDAALVEAEKMRAALATVADSIRSVKGQNDLGDVNWAGHHMADHPIDARAIATHEEEA